MSRKVFTAGEVLAAADVNSFLMDQTVMSFAGTAARGSAIPTPTLGMYTHLEDTPARTEFWNGSAWVSPFGETLVTTQTFTSTTAVNLENVFSSAYRNYKFVIDFTGASGGAQLQMRSGGTNNTANYSSNLLLGFGSSVTAVGRSTSGFSLFNQGNNDASVGYLYRPFLAATTVYYALGNQGQAVGIDGGFHNDASSFTSLGLIFSSAASGIVSIYGMR